MNWRIPLPVRMVERKRPLLPAIRQSLEQAAPAGPLPSLFVSHGAPDIVLSRHELLDALRDKAASLGRPRGIVVVSAHWVDDPVGITNGAELPTIHDFGGFPDALYKLRYPVRGDATLAADVAGLLDTHGFERRMHPWRGLDHGAWMPLMIMYPAADVPVVQVSVPAGSMSDLVRFGQALAPLRDEGVLILGSGGSVHNMRELNLRGRTDPWAAEFEDWLHETVEGGHFDDLTSPAASPAVLRRAHPTLEHFAPLVIAWAAGASDMAGRRFHHSFSYGNLGMSCFEFGQQAGEG